jgi:putative FmdB family regulatory protein
MPDYRYRCNDCEVMFNLTQDFDDNHDAAPCPQCGQPADRVWTVPVIVFKGDGFSLALQAEEVKESRTDPLCDGIEGLECLGPHIA